MSAVTPEAIERKRARNRAWKRLHPRSTAPPENCEGEDAFWLILVCERCFSFFDVKKGPGHRRPKLCEDCRR